MSLNAKPPSQETQPLLQEYTTYDSIDDERSSIYEEPSPPINKFSNKDLCWILAGLWSAVFLGALDGSFTFNRSVFDSLCKLGYHRHDRSNSLDSNRQLFQ